MAKDKDEKEQAQQPPQKQPDPPPPPAKAQVVPPVRKTMTFDIWFGCAERAKAHLNQPHHKAGMKAWAKTNGRRTKDEWDRLFEKY